MKINSLPVESVEPLSVGPFQDVHPETDIAGPLLLRQQVQKPPVVFHSAAGATLRVSLMQTAAVRESYTGTG